MLRIYPYNRLRAAAYAEAWALAPNPLFHHFGGLGGDCTNFVSQCILAGAGVMNETETFGWYYHTLSDRAPAWTGVDFLCNFLTENTGPGPFASLAAPDALEPGDVIQLGRADGTFYHTLAVTSHTGRDYLVCAHSFDVKNRRLSAYHYEAARFLHIEGYRAPGWSRQVSYDALLAGTSLGPG